MYFWNRIPDPETTKPDDWDENAPQRVPDPDAVKPEGWLDDGPEHIPDPDASLPEDWDEEEDGEWEPSLIGGTVCSPVKEIMFLFVVQSSLFSL